MIKLYVAERLDDLAVALADRLREPMADPLTPEVLVVPTSGMQRWLSLELSRHLGTSGSGRADGVSANLDMRFPGSLDRLLTSRDDDFDPWELDRLAWVLLEVLADSPESAESAPPPAPGATAWARARRLADLFDRYMTHRPAMIRAWATGTDVDGAGRPIEAHARWQPHLWRRVRERIGTPSPPELLPQRIAALQAGRCPDDVPERISLFGLSTIPGGAPLIEQLDALGTQREILLFLHQPSLALAGRVSAAAQSEAPTASAPHLRADDRSSSLVANPLLASWGRPAREAVVLLGDRCTRATSIPAPGAGSTPTLLARLQHDLRSDTAPEGTFELRDDDRSITLHSCYGDTRQVEVLRDQILHLLVDDPTLDEDDIVVFCPALGSFAPIIESVLGPPGDPVERIDDPGEALDDDGPRPVAPSLRYRLSDRSLGSTYPLLGALGALVELLASRFSDRAVLEFASLDPVSRRHGFDDDALSTIAGWIATANTRWGIDGRHRERWGIPAGHETGSWRRGVDRLLMGIAIETHGLTLAPGDLPPIGVEGSDTVVAGHLAGLLEHLARLAARAEESMPVHGWIELLRRASDDLFCADPDNPWESRRLSGVLARIEDAATVIDGGPHAEGAVGCRPARVDLTLDDIRHLIGAELGTSSGRSDFFRGGITFCTPTPLRAVPHRVVCLLGMDDSAFSAGAIDGDDLVTAEPHLGDRDRRADSRHVLLDCILAAREHLVVLRNGHNVVTNQEIPATVAVAELTDALRATVRRTGHDPVTDRLTVEHPRQRFDESNFHTDSRPGRDPVPPSAQLGLERPWSFDPSDCAGASARHDKSASPRFLVHPLAPVRPDTVTLSDLQEFLTHPPRYFLRRVLELSIPHPPKRDDASAGTQPAGSSGLPMAAPGRNLLVGLDSLEAWRLRQDLLTHRRNGGTSDSFEMLHAAGDLLPPRQIADSLLAEASELVEPVISVLHELCDPGATPEQIHVDIELGTGVRIIGSVRDDRGTLPGPITADMSSLKAKHLLGRWLDALALTAAHPGRPWQAVHIAGAKSTKHEPAVRTFAITGADGVEPGDPHQALEALEVVVGLFLRGHREPLPLFPGLSHALGTKQNTTSSSWIDNRGDGDGNDEWIQVAFDDADFHTITSLAVRDDDPEGEGDDRATRYATHLWDIVKQSSPGTELKL